MTQKSWQLDRRELLKGGGVALAIPLLNGMGKTMGATAKAAGEGGMPKRMLVSYFAYGAYMPDGPSGVPGSNKNDSKTTCYDGILLYVNSVWCYLDGSIFFDLSKKLIFH